MRGRVLRLVLAVLAVSITNTNSQIPEQRSNVGNCPPITGADLGSMDVASRMGVLAESFEGPDGLEPPLVRILEYRVVCEAAGLTRGTVSATSVVVRHECSGLQCPGSEVIQYLNLDCNPPGASGNASFLVPSPTVQIGRELSPGNAESLLVPRNIQCAVCSELARRRDNCAACDTACNEGQRRCLGQLPSQCCNWYLNNVCRVTCPPPLVGDNSTFDCGCSELTLSNGNIIYSNRFTLNSVATHTCDISNGYVLAPSSPVNRTCSESGWSGSNAVCQLFNCGPGDVVSPANGAVTFDRTTFGSVATFSCNTGFALIGDATRTCELTGWSGSNPTCVFECDRADIISPDNGAVSVNGSTLGSVATFTCNDSYTLIGDATRTCQLTGWSGSNPSCVFDCGSTDIIRPENGSVSLNQTTLGSVATFACDSGFTLIGDTTRTCQLTGWSGNNPSCAFDCGSTDIVQPANGSVVLDQTTLGSVANFSCDAGFALIGDATRTCQLTGWSGSNPSCVSDCGSVDIVRPENGTVQLDQTILGSMAIFACNDNFQLVGDEVRVCEPTGWSGSNPSCEFDCGSDNIVRPENGAVMLNQTTLGSVAIFSCNNSYELVGDEIRTCEVTGWSGNNPTCVFDCGSADIIRPNNGTVVLNQTTLGSVATFACNAGFALIGDATRTCELTGWSGSNPSCAFDCGSADIVRPDNGMVALNQTTLGSVAMFSCNTGFALIGDATRTCQLTGWSGSNPSCVFDCGSTDIVRPENGRVTLNQTTLGSAATFSCDASFVLVGDATRTCELTGWSGSNPSCVFDCGSADIVSPGNGSVSLPGTTLGSVATFSCNDNFTLVGDTTRTCRLTGWSGSNPICESMRNDTVIGDPLFTVPLSDSQTGQTYDLCFEVHGRNNSIFNFISDECVSVNAKYSPVGDLNIISEIGVRTEGESGECRDIRVSLEGCAVSTRTMGGGGGALVGLEPKDTLKTDGISVRRYRERVRISVPNCNQARLVFWVICERGAIDMIRFQVAHGLNLRATAHGLLGQFWNVPVAVEPFSTPSPSPSQNVEDERPKFKVTILSAHDSPSRSFRAEEYPRTWDNTKQTCYYAGNTQGGPDVDANIKDSVIEGSYEDYVMESLFSTTYKYAKWKSDCNP